MNQSALLTTPEAEVDLGSARQNLQLAGSDIPMHESVPSVRDTDRNPTALG